MRCGEPPRSDRYVDATDVLPGLLEDDPGCGRHCYKMLSILRHLRASVRCGAPRLASRVVERR